MADWPSFNVNDLDQSITRHYCRLMDQQQISILIQAGSDLHAAGLDSVNQYLNQK